MEKDYSSDWIEVVNTGVWDYDWQTLKIHYSPSAHRYFWDEQSGCSCNDWEDPGTIEEWMNGDREAALRAVDAFSPWNDRDFTLDDRLSAKAAVRDFNEPLDSSEWDW